MKVSNAVDCKIKELWAILASAAAKRAVDRIHAWGDVEGAEKFARTAEKWLAKAGAGAARYAYQQPRV